MSKIAIITMIGNIYQNLVVTVKMTVIRIGSINN